MFNDDDDDDIAGGNNDEDTQFLHIEAILYSLRVVHYLIFN